MIDLTSLSSKDDIDIGDVGINYVGINHVGTGGQGRGVRISTLDISFTSLSRFFEPRNYAMMKSKSLFYFRCF